MCDPVSRRDVRPPCYRVPVSDVPGTTCLESRLAAFAAAAAILEWPFPRERDEATCCELARILDALLVRVARGKGALDVAVGEALEVMGTGGRVFDLGFSGVGDYAREVLGIPASTAQKMARFARRLRERPLLRAAVWSGEVSLRAAEAVLPRARGEEEAAWVARARTGTVCSLKAAIKGAGGEAEGRRAQESVESVDPLEEDEKWTRVRAKLTPEQRAIVDEALDLARKAMVHGATAPTWRLVGALCEEYLGAHALPDGMLADRVVPPSRRDDDLVGPLEG